MVKTGPTRKKLIHMKNLIALIGCLLMTGCASDYTRMKVGADEQTQFHFRVNHALSRAGAFDRMQVWLATNFKNYSAVCQLEQPQSGTFILKPVITYNVGGALGAEWVAPYTMKIVAVDNSATLDFELHPEPRYGAWPPKHQMPRIQAEFKSISESVAAAVGGSLSP